MKEFSQYIIGNISLPMFCALYFFALIGVIVNLLVHSNKRDQASKSTPGKFSLKFLARDNRTRLFVNLLVLFVTIRFMPGLMNFDPENSEFYLAGSFFVGWSIDKGLELWKSSKYGAFLKEKRDPVVTNDPYTDTTVIDKG